VTPSSVRRDASNWPVAAEPITPTGAGLPAGRSAASAPSDVRVANMLRLLAEIRAQGSVPRSDLARATGLAVPTVHRLIAELADLGLLAEDAPAADESRLGRPPLVYRFRGEAGALVGADIGNGSTRLAVASLAGHVLASRSLATADITGDLIGGVTDLIAELLAEVGQPAESLAGIGVGIASAVDPGTGVLRDPPQHRHWHGLPFAAELHSRLQCEVAVEQDDHLASLAESSSVGTVPGARSVVVLSIGKGIGVGMTVDSRPVPGMQGRFGRIASWPARVPRGVRLPGPTLGESLATDGLVAQYHARGGRPSVTDGVALFAAAREGDPAARSVVAWAGREIADLVQRLAALCDAEAIVFGGGLAGGFDLLEREIGRHADTGSVNLARTALGEHAVLTGALLAAQNTVMPWLVRQLTRS
jgi:predicted NBD/HSP70 family sugar kinase